MNFYCVCIAQLSDGIYRIPSPGICYIDWFRDIGLEKLASIYA